MKTPTYAIVGGLIEANESPVDAAQRELREELNMISDDWIGLGSYRPAANRGGGITYTYLARGCRPTHSDVGNMNNDKAFASSPHQLRKLPAIGELERQDIIQLTKDELLQNLLDGRFQEIKWTATIALALLRQPNDSIAP